MKKERKGFKKSLIKFFKNIEDFSYALGTVAIRKITELVLYAKETFTAAAKKNFNKSKLITENTSEEISKEVITTVKTLVSVKNTLRNVFAASKHEFKNGFFKGISGSFKIFVSAFRRGKRFYSSLFNIAAPIVSFFILIGVIGYVSSLRFGVCITINGEEIATVANETIYETAQKRVQERIVYQDAGDAIVFKPTYRLTVVSADELSTVNELTDKLIYCSSDAICEAYGLYVDNEFEGAVMNTEEVEAALNARLDAYKTGAEGEVVTFAQEIQFVYGYYLNNTVKEPSEMTEFLNSEIAGSVYYTVEAGDTPIGIAERHGISYDELLVLNPDMGMLYPGSQVLVSASVPYLNVVVTRQEVYNVSVAYTTETRTSSSYYVGYSFVSVAGKNGTNQVTANVTYTDGIETGRNVTDTVVVTAPVNRVIVQGTKIPTSVSAGDGTYIWPVGNGGGWISCHFGGYVGHTGMDIATPQGTPIYAVAAGKVIASQHLTYGLGRYIAIDHGNGVVTYYGHNSVLYVSVGQYVTKGQVIALSGNTGRSTGPHLHISFLVNGSYRNPYHYLTR